MKVNIDLYQLITNLSKILKFDASFEYTYDDGLPIQHDVKAKIWVVWKKDKFMKIDLIDYSLWHSNAKVTNLLLCKSKCKAKPNKFTFSWCMEAEIDPWPYDKILEEYTEVGECDWVKILVYS